MDISDWRNKIDEVDAAVLKLLNLRAEMALEIGKLKSQDGIGLRAPAREREIVERMQAANPGPLDSEAIEKIYETIVNQCIRAQERNRSGLSAHPSENGVDQSPTAAKRNVAHDAKKSTKLGNAKRAGNAAKSRKGKK